MDVAYYLQGIEFEWDSEKAATNEDKHGVRFTEAIEVFFDPLSQTGEASVGEEPRDYLIGYSFSLRLFLVVYTMRDTRTRIISARPATRTERESYENR